MHVAVLTGGGDCPGLNAVIRAVTLSLLAAGVSRVSGVEQGFLGLLEDRIRPLTDADVRNLLNVGGTLLGTHNRADPFHYFGEGGADCSARAMACLERYGIDVLVALGGNGTMTIAERFARLGVPVVGVPKTIDNDLMHNERSFGFDSAVAVVAEALGRLETTARSHGRVMVLETMGRHAGWIALEGGLAGGADAIVLPEVPYCPDRLADLCRRRLAHSGYALVCVAEGAAPQTPDMAAATDPLAQAPAGTGARHAQYAPGARLGGVGQCLMDELAARLDAPSHPTELRYTLLGHLQRGGAPTAYDRVLSTRFGIAAAQLVRQGLFGQMVALQGDRCVHLPLADVAGQSRRVPPDHELMVCARDLGVCLG